MISSWKIEARHIIFHDFTRLGVGNLEAHLTIQFRAMGWLERYMLCVISPRFTISTRLQRDIFFNCLDLFLAKSVSSLYTRSKACTAIFRCIVSRSRTGTMVNIDYLREGN